jgi:hypothetical protein
MNRWPCNLAAALLLALLLEGNSMAQSASQHEANLKNADGTWKYTNALARETSPYHQGGSGRAP